jgi:hypothetical protein
MSGIFVGAYFESTILDSMRAARQIRKWDRVRTEFVDVTIENELDIRMSCNDCRYFDSNSGKCHGVGSHYYLKQVPFAKFVPKPHECQVRLPPSLLTFF